MKTLKILALGVLMLLVAVPMVGAQTWDSSFNIVNLGTTEAEVSVTFHEMDGTAHMPTQLGTSTGLISNPFFLAVGTSVEVLPFQTPELPDGRYSVVISSDQQIAAIANLTTWIAGEGAPYFNGSYSGAEDLGETMMYMPAIVWDYYGWNSHVSVQNLAMDDATMTVDFYEEGSDTVCATYDPGAVVPNYSAIHIDVTSDVDLTPCDTDGEAGYNGSAVINSDMPVAAVDNQTVAMEGWYGPAGRTQTYNGFLMTQANDMLYIPGLYYLYYGWDSSFNVQNLGTTDAAVTVTYSDGCTKNATIPPNGSYLFYQWAEGEAGGCHTAGTQFAAVVESDAGQPLVAVVNAATNQSDGYWAPLNQSQSYSAFPGGGTNVSFPLIMMEYYGWTTSYTIQNVGANDVNLLVSYGDVATCQNLPLGPIAPGASEEVYQGADSLCPDLPTEYRNAVTVEVVEVDGQIIGIANQTNFTNRDEPTTTGDWSQSYNGLVSTP